MEGARYYYKSGKVIVCRVPGDQLRGVGRPEQGQHHGHPARQLERHGQFEPLEPLELSRATRAHPTNCSTASTTPSTSCAFASCTRPPPGAATTGKLKRTQLIFAITTMKLMKQVFYNILLKEYIDDR